MVKCVSEVIVVFTPSDVFLPFLTQVISLIGWPDPTILLHRRAARVVLTHWFGCLAALLVKGHSSPYAFRCDTRSLPSVQLSTLDPYVPL